MAGYQEGQRLQGSDGKIYVVRNGVPVVDAPAPNMMNPKLPFEVQQAQGQAAAAPYAAPKAQAEAQIAQANAGVAGTVANADAQRAVAEAQRAQAELEAQRVKSKGKPVEDARAELNRIIGQIDAINSDANDNGGWFETGYLGSLNRNRAGTAAFDLNEAIKTIDANSAFSKLAQMRQESPTGAALGSITEKELDLLKSTISNLNPDQSHESFLNSLGTARGHYAGMLERLGGEAPPPPQDAAPAPRERYTTDAGYHRDPALAGVEKEYRKRLARGDDTDKLLAFLKSTGVPLDPALVGSIRDQVEFKRQNPKVPVTNFKTDMIEMRWRDGSGVVGKIADSPAGAFGVAGANAVSAGLLDEIVGLTGGNQAQAQLAKEVLRERNPGSSLAGDIAGAATGMGGMNAGLRFAGGRLAPLATRYGGLGGDALYGAAFGAGENNDDRLTGAALGAGSAVAGNLAGRAAVNAIGRPLRGVADPAIRYLNERGVRMTPGQIMGQGGVMGRGYRAVEDALGSVPYLGSAIRERKMDGLRDFNREAFRDALDPINQQVQGVIGQDAIGEAQDLVSGAYGNALTGTSLRADMPFTQQAAQAIRAGRRVPEYGDDVNYLVRENLGPTFGPGRTLNGEGFQSSLQDIADTAADFRKAGNVRGRNANRSMQELRQAYFDLADRQAPGTTGGLTAANAANRNVSILGDAVNTSINSQVESGVFSPAQLGRAAVNNTKKFGGKRQAARGNVPFRELQEAGQSVLPDVVPNSGTADRAWASMILPATLGGGALGAEHLGADTKTVGALAALSALSTRRGNQVAQQLLVSRNPILQQLGEEVLRGRRLGGMFGAGAAIPLLNQ